MTRETFANRYHILNYFPSLQKSFVSESRRLYHLLKLLTPDIYCEKYLNNKFIHLNIITTFNDKQTISYNNSINVKMPEFYKSNKIKKNKKITFIEF